MYTIDLLMEEHKNIIKFARIVRNIALRTMKTQIVNVNDYYKIIDFVRNYADEHHHKKEEKVLFSEMEKLSETALKIIRNGMFVEHDMGRLFIMELEKALKRYEIKKSDDDIIDIISNSVAYTGLIERHAKKEDDVVYVFGIKNLSEESRTYIDRETDKIEKEATQKGIQKKYIDLLNELDRKYKYIIW